MDYGLSMGEAALSWLLHQPGVTSVLVGARTPAQLTMNAQAAELTLPDELINAMSAATEGIKDRLGANLDMYQSESRIR